MYVKRGEKVGSYYYKNWYFRAKPIPTGRDWNKTRLLGQESLSPAALLKLEWIIFYYGLGRRDATGTAKQFGISRQTFHKWLRRFKQ